MLGSGPGYRRPDHRACLTTRSTTPDSRSNSSLKSRITAPRRFVWSSALVRSATTWRARTVASEVVTGRTIRAGCYADPSATTGVRGWGQGVPSCATSVATRAASDVLCVVCGVWVRGREAHGLKPRHPQGFVFLRIHINRV